MHWSDRGVGAGIRAERSERRRRGGSGAVGATSGRSIELALSGGSRGGSASRRSAGRGRSRTRTGGYCEPEAVLPWPRTSRSPLSLGRRWTSKQELAAAVRLAPPRPGSGHPESDSTDRDSRRPWRPGCGLPNLSNLVNTGAARGAPGKIANAVALFLRWVIQSSWKGGTGRSTSRRDRYLRPSRPTPSTMPRISHILRRGHVRAIMIHCRRSEELPFFSA